MCGGEEGRAGEEILTQHMVFPYAWLILHEVM